MKLIVPFKTETEYQEAYDLFKESIPSDFRDDFQLFIQRLFGWQQKELETTAKAMISDKDAYINKVGRYAPHNRPVPDLSWTKVEMKTFMDEYSVSYNSGDSKQDLLDKILGHNYG